MTKNLLILLLVVFSFFKSQAQIDTSFWFVAPDISGTMGENPIVFHFQTYDQASIVAIRQPAFLGPGAVNFSFSINPFSTFTLDLTSFLVNVESAPVNTVSSKGIYISSKENISVFYTIGDQFTQNKEMISLKGRRALGTDFYATIPYSPGVLTHTISDGGVGFDVVAVEPGITTLLITPRAACIGHPKNITFVRTLTQGQTFSMLDNNAVNPSELAGSIISSDKLIAVTVKGSIITGTSVCPSYFSDQITPSDGVGKDYVILRGNGTADIAYILASQNATSFTVSGSSSSVVSLINATETFSVNISSPVTYVHSDKPVYVFHLSGYGCKSSGAQLAPVYCAGSYTSAFIRFSPDSLNLNICTRTGYQNSFTLTSNSNTVPVPASSFSPVPGSGGNLVAARLFFPISSIPLGSYNELRNNADLFGLAVHNGGFAGGSGYAQASNFRIDAYAIAGAAPTATTCANTPFTLNGTVGGGPLTGVWSLIDGYGTFLNGPTQLTNNTYIPSLLDTTNNDASISPNNRFVKVVLNSTGVCPNVADTLKLHVKQPPIVSAGANSVICGNHKTLQLNGDVYGATDQGNWNILIPGSGNFIAGVNTFTPTYQLSMTDTVQTFLQFVLTSTNNGGCNPVDDTVTVYINKPPIVIASAVNPITKCSNNNTVTLAGSVSGTATSTGIWGTPGSGIFTPNNTALNASYIPGFNDLSNGSVWLYLQSTNNGICFPTWDSVQVLFTNPSFVNAGSDINTCMNNARAALSGAITGTNTSSVSWLGGNGVYLPGNSALTATYLATPAEVAAGFITLTLTTNNNGLCFGTDDVMRINFQQKPIANFTVSSVCLGQTTSFTDKSTNPSQVSILNQWTWNFGDGSPLSNNQSPLHNYTSVGNYTAQLILRNSFNCFDTLQGNVLVNAIPTASFQFSRDCSGSAQLINFIDRSQITAPDVLSPKGHYWDFGGYGFAFAKDTSVIFPSEGIYNITHIVSSDKGCQSVISKSVEITPRPFARFIYLNNSVPGLGANVTFRDTSSFAQSWAWDFGNGETANSKHPVVFYKENGLYVVKLTITDQYGCPSTYSLEVKIANIVTQIVNLIPNVITPNNDGKNDFWRLDFIDVFFPKAEIEIYNRWGQKIFRSEGYSNAWDGSFRGEPLPVGAYFYTIDLKDQATPVIKGTITLIK